jgi:pyruvate,water dikinase
MIRHVIESAHAAEVKVGLCGQAPSDHPEFAEFLVECGIDSISVTPDSFLAVKGHVAAAERSAPPSCEFSTAKLEAVSR